MPDDVDYQESYEQLRARFDELLWIHVEYTRKAQETVLALVRENQHLKKRVNEEGDTHHD